MFAIWDNLADEPLAGTYPTVEDANNALVELLQLHVAQVEDLAEDDGGPEFNLSIREI